MTDHIRLAMTTAAETYDRICDPLAAHGIEVDHVDPTARPVTISTDGIEDAGTHTRAVTPAYDVGFVYPSRLMEGAVFDTRLSVPWVNDADAVLTSRNKAGVLAALAAVDLPVPRTIHVSNPTDESAVVDAVAALSFPVVIKPNSATRGVGVAKATDLDSLLGVIDYLNLIHDYRATGDKSYLIQEYLSDACDYRAMVVEGTCVGGVQRTLSTDALAAGRWKHNVHRGATARGVDLDPELRALAERAASVLDIDYLGVDLLETADRVVINETNARPTIDESTKYDDGFYAKLAGLIKRVAASG